VLSRPGHSFKERDLATLCASCKTEWNLADCRTEADARVRTYRCNSCGNLLLVVGIPDDRPVQVDHAPGTRWWAIRPIADLIVQMKESRMVIPGVQRSPVLGQPVA